MSPISKNYLWFYFNYVTLFIIIQIRANCSTENINAFACSFCEFSTNREDKFEIHLKTTRHINNYKENSRNFKKIYVSYPIYRENGLYEDLVDHLNEIEEENKKLNEITIKLPLIRDKNKILPW